MGQEDLIMVEVTKYVTDNYNGLWEIYTTKIDQDKYNFDDFCMMMYITHLKSKKNMKEEFTGEEIHLIKHALNVVGRQDQTYETVQLIFSILNKIK
jgi:hypothetical protein